MTQFGFHTRTNTARLLFVLLLCTAGIEANWPICYDYKVQDTTKCPKRDSKGRETTGDQTYPFCYHTNMWQVSSPPPDCRDTGCETDPDSSCCCGADPILPTAKDPNFDSDPTSECGKYGQYSVTGASAGQCAACQEGLGADDGFGGKVREIYGNLETPAGTLDVQTFGHINDLSYKLPTCSSGMKTVFAKAERVVNEECDVKSFLALRKCGNCWRAICEFHNNLHWWNGGAFECFQDLFLRRLECYANWYYKYCDCGVTIPEEPETVWRKSCRQSPFFVYDDSRSPPVYPICSTASHVAVSINFWLLVLLAAAAFVWTSSPWD